MCNKFQFLFYYNFQKQVFSNLKNTVDFKHLLQNKTKARHFLKSLNSQGEKTFVC